MRATEKKEFKEQMAPLRFKLGLKGRNASVKGKGRGRNR